MKKNFSKLINLYNAFVYGLLFLLPGSLFIGVIFLKVELSEFLLITLAFVLSYALVVSLFSYIESKMMGKLLREYEEDIHSEVAIPCIYRFEEELMENYCVMKATERHISFHTNDGEVINDINLLAEQLYIEKNMDFFAREANHGITVVKFKSSGITIITLSDQWEKFKLASHIRVSESVKSHRRG